jgi:hypothetical protein
MEAIGTYEILGAFGNRLKDVCTIQTFGATYGGIEVLLEVRDYASHPEGRFHVTMRRVDDGRETRGKPADTLARACSTIQWSELEDPKR